MNNSREVLSFIAFMAPYGGTVKRFEIWLRVLPEKLKIRFLIGAADSHVLGEKLLANCAPYMVKVLDCSKIRPRVLARVMIAANLGRLPLAGNYGCVLSSLTNSSIIAGAVIYFLRICGLTKTSHVPHVAGVVIPVKDRKTIRGSLYRFCVRLIYQDAAAVVAISEATKREIVSEFRIDPSKVHVVPISLQTKKWDTAPSETRCANRNRPFTFGIFSRLTAEKGAVDAVRAFNSSRCRDHVRLNVYGTGPIEGFLRDLTRDLRLTDCVRFLGYQPAEVVLSEIDCAILASYGEGVPRSILEAGFSGVPFIASRVGGIPELITHGVNGWLFEAGDIGALSALIDRVAKEPTSARLAGQKMHDYVCANFRPVDEANNLCEVLSRHL